MGNSANNTENTGSPKHGTERRIIKGEKVKKTTDEIVKLTWWQKLLYVIYFIGLFLGLTYLLLTLWPHAPPAGETAVAEPVWHVWKFKLTISEEARYIMIVAVMGALGGLAFSARYYAYFVGEKKFIRAGIFCVLSLDLCWLSYFILHSVQLFSLFQPAHKT
jgi:hypothetical protein